MKTYKIRYKCDGVERLQEAKNAHEAALIVAKKYNSRVHWEWDEADKRLSYTRYYGVYYQVIESDENKDEKQNGKETDMSLKKTYEAEVLADVEFQVDDKKKVETKVLFSGKKLFASEAGAVRWAEIEAHKAHPEVDLDAYEVTVRPFQRD